MSGDDPRSAAERRAAAHHEAGHAVASWRLGDGVGTVTIKPGVNSDGTPNGGHFELPRTRERTIASGWSHRYLVMVLAGAAAQRAHDPCSAVLSCAAHDLRSAGDLAAIMSTSREAARALLLWAHAEARARVAADRHLVEALAAALLVATTLSGEAATAVLVAADQVERAACAEVRAALSAAV